jgi:hypothetical protein
MIDDETPSSGRPADSRISTDERSDPSGPTPMTLRLGPVEISAVSDAAEVFLAFEIAGEAHRILEDLYLMFASWGHAGGTG